MMDSVSDAISQISDDMWKLFMYVVHLKNPAKTVKRCSLQQESEWELREKKILHLINNKQFNYAFLFSSIDKLLNTSKTIPTEFFQQINVTHLQKQSSQCSHFHL